MPYEPDESLRRHLDLVHGTCLRVLGNAQDAADATQEVAMKWMRSHDRIRGSTAAWLHAAAHGTAVDMIRRREARRRAERASALPSAGGQAGASDITEHLDAALADLPDMQRALLLEHHLEGCNQAELARRWRISQGHVSKRLAQARDLLAGALAKRGVAIGGVALITALAGEAHAATCPGPVFAAAAERIPAAALPGGRIAGGMVWGLAIGIALVLLAAGFLFTPTARLPPGEVPVVAVALAPPAPGLAVRHPGDVGIASDPAVLFHDGFEDSGFARWDDRDGNPRSTNSIIDGPGEAHSGRRAARLTVARSPGAGDLVKWFVNPGRDTHARWYWRLDGAGAPLAPGSLSACLLALRERSDLGNDEQRPDGTNAFGLTTFTVALGVPSGSSADLGFKTWQPEVRAHADGRLWRGHSIHPSGQPVLAAGAWHCVEIAVTANTPGERDGAFTCWVDGEPALRETGIRWRDTPALAINCLWLNLVLRGAAPQRRVDIDDVVVASGYIGPMAPIPP